MQEFFMPIQESLSCEVTSRERINKVSTYSFPNLVVYHLDCPKCVCTYINIGTKHKVLPFPPHHLI